MHTLDDMSQLVKLGEDHVTSTTYDSLLFCSAHHMAAPPSLLLLSRHIGRAMMGQVHLGLHDVALLQA
jgi:hypothetical protein